MLRAPRRPDLRADNGTPAACGAYLGELPEVLSALVTRENEALARERTLCTGGNYRFDPLLLPRAHLPGWGAGPAPQRLLYYCKSDGVSPIIVADRVERLEILAAAGTVPANGVRLQLKDRLTGWVLRCLCEAVCPGYTAFSTVDRPERWAQALTGHYFGHIVLMDVALKAYLTHADVDARSAGDRGESQDITAALDRVRNALHGEPARLTNPGDEKGEHLLQAIARALAGGLLQRGGAEPRQIKKMLLGVTSEYRIEPACADR